MSAPAPDPRRAEETAGGAAAAAVAGRDVSRLRLWLRMLDGSNLVQRAIRQRLRDAYNVTLPRFDLMAALDRAGPDGMTMGQLSRRLRVSNGNVTAVVDRLAKEGAVVRRSPPEDRRTSFIALTEEGRRQFAEMAVAHLGWIDDLLAGLDDAEVAELTRLMEKARTTAQARVDAAAGEQTGEPR
ncbi:MAG: MarR family transcriptional regulator [Alphaproteobacteria bacterium]|nr:MarR family transcriptional regulator [Alphaproteobacteria bacterium]